MEIFLIPVDTPERRIIMNIIQINSRLSIKIPFS